MAYGDALLGRAAIMAWLPLSLAPLSVNRRGATWNWGINTAEWAASAIPAPRDDRHAGPASIEVADPAWDSADDTILTCWTACWQARPTRSICTRLAAFRRLNSLRFVHAGRPRD